MFIGQGDCTYMRAEDIEGSNLLDIVISHGGVLADFPGLANLAHAYSNALVDALRSTAAHTSFGDVNSHGSAGTASHVLCSLNNEHRLVLSLLVLASMKTASKGKWWQKSLREWELEVRSYKSSLLFVNEEPERVVFLSAIEVRSW